MFGRAYFGGRYYSGRYFGSGGSVAPIVVARDTHDGVAPYDSRTPRQRKKEREEEDRKRKLHWQEELAASRQLRELLVEAFDPTPAKENKGAPDEEVEAPAKTPKDEPTRFKITDYPANAIAEINNQIAQLQNDVKAIKPDIIESNVEIQQKELKRLADLAAVEDEEEAQLVMKLVADYENDLIAQHMQNLKNMIFGFSK